MAAPDKDTDERRRALRVPLFAQIQVKHGKYTFVMEVVNISRSGMLIDVCEDSSPPWVREGFNVEISLDLPDVLDEAVALEARIVRVEPGEGRRTPRFAAIFVLVDRPTRIKLDGLIAHTRTSPPPLPV